MKELLLSYAQYNAWANEALLGAICALPAEQQERELVSSFPSLRRTLLHLLDAASIWWQRVQLQEKVVRPSDSFGGDGDALALALKKIDAQWLEFVQKAGEHVLQHEFIYLDSKRVQHKSVTGHVLQHLFNHATYHRGQLVTMLRQVGAPTVSNTDYIAWSWKKHA
ncbi:DinB family protein [Flaviaesturariibacter aridisoli]|uniref:Damage-inducible protein DinB n=1 Tax=Flaviaesturariibacter aridisoli TaxID=2545761 RepID=A0A4R4E0R1_9BACT|nr:DinB family protein [Flaviaesturariibacter aridisoli]TCZ67727.1 hypothetical protein E0486_15310 [Flaviaesturariibacter aridisoli]